MISNYKLFFFNPSTLSMNFLVLLNDFILMFLSCIMIVLLINMVFIMTSKLNFNYFYEMHTLEFIWTVIPFLILMVFILPSLKFLYMMDSTFIPFISVFVMGHQWYWSYSNNFSYNSYMKDKNFFIRLIETDNSLILCSNVSYRILGSSSDVIHSWTIPSAGLKMDVMPGRINQMNLYFLRPGLFYGQCSEICGINHSFMPIFIESIMLKDYLKVF